MMREVPVKKYARWVSWCGRVLAAALLAGVAVGCHRDSVGRYLEAGREAMQHNRLGQAEQNLNAAEKLAPSDPKVHRALGEFYVLKHNTDAARQEFTRAIELDPKDIASRLELARLLVQLSRIGSAQEQYLAVVAYDPANVDAHFGLGEIYRSQGKADEAERELRTVLGLAPKDAEAHYALAMLLSSQSGRQQEAQAELMTVRALNPSLLPPTTVVNEANPAPSNPAQAQSSKPQPNAAEAAAEKIKSVKQKRFLLSHDSPVYNDPDEKSKVVARVHRGKYVMVTGVGDKWLRVRLRTGIVGFIPITAVE